MTVQHSLDHLARLGPGQSVLVHGAAGGVGLAAIQYAQLVGAEVIATAGSPAKRDLLRLLGVEHVLDSRTLHFAERVRDITGGDGVDVVLNSLAGEALTRSLGLLKPGGRFVELGKRDILADNPLPLAAFEANAAFFAVDVSPMLTGGSALADAHIAAIATAVRSGDYRPLPHRTYPASRIREAFACLQHSRHIGKVVVTFDEPVPVSRPVAPVTCDPEATYLIVGGLGGFGAATARYLAERGARHLALVGRRGAASPEAPALVADLRARGVTATPYAADATDRAALAGVLAGIDASGRRLGGVVHAAMVLDDAPLTELTAERMRAVIAPKVTAGYLLDELTRGRELDFFVVYSSAAATVGNLLQAPYVAANTALDALVRQRRREGLPGLSVQWNALGGAGYVERTGIEEKMTALGLGLLPAGQALEALGELLGDPGADVVAVGLFDWGRLLGNLPRLAAPRTAGFLPDVAAAQDARNLRAAVVQATPETAEALVADAVAEMLAQVMQAAPDRIDRERRLDLLGVDSLMAAELALLLRRNLDCEVSAMEVTAAANLTALAHRLAARMRSVTNGAR